jgi:hypothetical protein
VQVPGKDPASVAVLGLQRSDMRLLAAAEKLGPHIQEAATRLAAQAPAHASAQNGKPASSSGSSKQPLANGSAKKAAAGCLVVWWCCYLLRALVPLRIQRSIAMSF